MEVRLADRMGLLRGDVNKFQKWAVTYLIQREEEVRVDREELALRNHTYVTDPERWNQLFGKDKNLDGDSEPMTEDDIDKIENFLSTMGDVKTASGADKAGEWI